MRFGTDKRLLISRLDQKSFSWFGQVDTLRQTNKVTLQRLNMVRLWRTGPGEDWQSIGKVCNKQHFFEGKLCQFSEIVNKLCEVRGLFLEQFFVCLQIIRCNVVTVIDTCILYFILNERYASCCDLNSSIPIY